MQTFLPYQSFTRSAAVLDRQRLGKQRVEAWQIFCALSDPSYGWQNHPAVTMWRGSERALLRYGIIICTEWIRRGYEDSMRGRFETAQARYISKPYCDPFWLGDKAFHSSHQSNLIRKFPRHYRPLWPRIPADLPYVWPSKLQGVLHG